MNPTPHQPPTLNGLGLLVLCTSGVATLAAVLRLVLP